MSDDRCQHCARSRKEAIRARRFQCSFISIVLEIARRTELRILSSDIDFFWRCSPLSPERRCVSLYSSKMNQLRCQYQPRHEYAPNGKGQGPQFGSYSKYKHALSSLSSERITLKHHFSVLILLFASRIGMVVFGVCACVCYMGNWTVLVFSYLRLRIGGSNVIYLVICQHILNNINLNSWTDAES